MCITQLVQLKTWFVENISNHRSSINAKAHCEQYAWLIQNLHNACSEKGPLFKGIKDLPLKLWIYHTAAVKRTDTALFKDDHRVQKILSQTKPGSDLEVMDWPKCHKNEFGIFFFRHGLGVPGWLGATSVTRRGKKLPRLTRCSGQLLGFKWLNIQTCNSTVKWKKEF